MEGVNLGKGALSLYSRFISSNTNRVFWSGGSEALSAALEYANTTGATTLEMTTVGKTLSKIGEYLPYKVMKPLWQITSKAYATGVMLQI